MLQFSVTDSQASLPSVECDSQVGKECPRNVPNIRIHQEQHGFGNGQNDIVRDGAKYEPDDHEQQQVGELTAAENISAGEIVFDEGEDPRLRFAGKQLRHVRWREIRQG